jgi:hypothetical protein
MIFERANAGGKDRYTFELASNTFALQHEEFAASGASMLRNRHEFRRTGT